MTKHDIIQAEKVRAAKVWHDLCAVPLVYDPRTGEGPYEPIIQSALLQARADQVRDTFDEFQGLYIEGLKVSEIQKTQYRLATALETAAKEGGSHDAG